MHSTSTTAVAREGPAGTGKTESTKDPKSLGSEQCLRKNRCNLDFGFCPNHSRQGSRVVFSFFPPVPQPLPLLQKQQKQQAKHKLQKPFCRELASDICSRLQGFGEGSGCAVCCTAPSDFWLRINANSSDRLSGCKGQHRSSSGLQLLRWLRLHCFALRGLRLQDWLLVEVEDESNASWQRPWANSSKASHPPVLGAASTSSTASTSRQRHCVRVFVRAAGLVRSCPWSRSRCTAGNCRNII